MNLQRKTYDSSGEKAIDFFIGFVGFYVGNGILWGIISLLDGLARAATVSSNVDPSGDILLTVGLVLYCGVFVINIAALILFGLTRYWIALGILGAFTTSLIVAICASLVIGGLCFALLYGITQAEGGALIFGAFQWLR